MNIEISHQTKLKKKKKQIRWLFEITEQTQTKFEEITQRELVIQEDQQ